MEITKVHIEVIKEEAIEATIEKPITNNRIALARTRLSKGTRRTSVIIYIVDYLYREYITRLIKKARYSSRKIDIARSTTRIYTPIILVLKAIDPRR